LFENECGEVTERLAEVVFSAGSGGVFLLFGVKIHTFVATKTETEDES